MDRFFLYNQNAGMNIVMAIIKVVAPPPATATIIPPTVEKNGEGASVEGTVSTVLVIETTEAGVEVENEARLMRGRGREEGCEVEVAIVGLEDRTDVVTILSVKEEGTLGRVRLEVTAAELKRDGGIGKELVLKIAEDIDVKTRGSTVSAVLERVGWTRMVSIVEERVTVEEGVVVVAEDVS